MAYIEFNPSKRLRHIIDKFWLSDNHIDNISRIFPDCSMDIIFNLGDSYFSKDRFENKIYNNEIILTGMMTNFSDVFINKDTKIFGVRFKPLGLNYFISFNFNSIKNNVIKINELIPTYWFELFQNVFLYKNIEDIIESFEDSITRILTFNDKSLDNDIQIFLNNNQRYNNSSVNSAIKNIYTTQRQLEIKFKKEIGISMKEFINIERFKRIKETLKISNKSLTEIAVENGYYDSSHFCKEVKKYTGYTPKELK